MEIRTLLTAGFEPAIIAMRNPMNSWDKSDSEMTVLNPDIGEKDKELSLRLQKNGPEHCKHLRMIQVWVDITAGLHWWKQFDCYRFGVEKISTSTMHKLMSRPLELSDFEYSEECETALRNVINAINSRIAAWHNETDPEYAKELWRSAVQLLPESYLQKRTVMMSYAALRNIVRQRAGHKLKEWEFFIKWAHTLPESWMIFE